MSPPLQPNLFDDAPPLPEGFRYQPELLPPDAEQNLLAHVAGLPFRQFDFHGYLGRRRVVSFGWRYDFSARALRRGDEIPEFVLPVRSRVAAFAGLDPSALEHVLVTEYSPGAAIGWHRDKAVFGDVIGVSLLAACRFRLRRAQAGGWRRAALELAPRSAYLLAGPARAEWEHSIPPVDRLRYSLTFRTLSGSG